MSSELQLSPLTKIAGFKLIFKIDDFQERSRRLDLEMEELSKESNLYAETIRNRQKVLHDKYVVLSNQLIKFTGLGYTNLVKVTEKKLCEIEKESRKLGDINEYIDYLESIRVGYNSNMWG